MLRLIHNQTTPGAILIDDIDDGLPNKEVHRLGSTADPKAYVRDGYANKPKQNCYIPRTKKGDASVPGYIDLNETERVQHSAGKGKIQKHQQVGNITVVSFQAADVSAPTLATAQLGGGNLTLTGTKLTSLLPNTTRVILTGTGAVTLTQAQIIAGGGTIDATTIVIPVALVPGAVAVNTSAKVVADDLMSEIVALS